jgi:phage baseplate assembly protein W
MAVRQDYTMPFDIDVASGEGAEAPYPVHVEQMIRQVLLTSPGERIDMPEFGCGLRSLVFASRTDGLSATTQILVKQSLDRWLCNQIKLEKVTVLDAADQSDPAEIVIEIVYSLIEDRSQRRTQVRVLA